MNQTTRILIVLTIIFFIAAPWMAVNLLAVTVFSYVVFGRILKARLWWLPVAITSAQFVILILMGALH